MEIVTRFKAIDGREFTIKEECRNYELLIERVHNIMALLPKTPEDDCTNNFCNGDGFIQHDKNELRSAKIKILELCKEYIKHDWIQQAIDDENADPSYVDRLIGEQSNISPLNSAWYRFMCIDKMNREWGQPYYALNPERGKMIQLNEQRK